MAKHHADETLFPTTAPAADPATCPVAHSACDVVTALASLRLENARLLAQTRTDHLTGLFNHRHFLEALDSEMERTLRSREPTALMMLDLDHFKRVNDTWGHEVGNQALVHTARILRESVRRIDVPCRYGGEEFAVVIPGTSLAGVVAVAERLRRRIEASPLPVGGKRLRLTASLGVAIFSGETAVGREQFVHTADGFLYEAKRDGRNRVGHPPLRAVAATQVTADERAMLFS